MRTLAKKLAQAVLFYPKTFNPKRQKSRKANAPLLRFNLHVCSVWKRVPPSRGWISGTHGGDTHIRTGSIQSLSTLSSELKCPF